MSDFIDNPNDAIKSPFYPLSLYRDGSEFLWDGRPTDCLIVSDADEHEAAKGEGWVEAAEYPHATAREVALLDQSAPKIIEALPTLPLEQLEAYRAAEEAGKARKGVLAAFDAAIDEHLKG